MSAVIRRGNAKVNMNMTPLIDVTFQLIIFFMLVNNIIAEENLTLVPPNLENPKTTPLEVESTRVIVNVAQDANININDRKDAPLNYRGEMGIIRVGIEDCGTDISKVVATLKQAVANSDKDEEGNVLVEVLLRADSALYYSEVQQVMSAITEAQVQKVHLVAMMPDEDVPPVAAE